MLLHFLLLDWDTQEPLFWFLTYLCCFIRFEEWLLPQKWYSKTFKQFLVLKQILPHYGSGYKLRCPFLRPEFPIFILGQICMKIPFVEKCISCFVLLPWPDEISRFRFYFLQKRLKWAEILHEDYYSQMQMIYLSIFRWFFSRS